MSPSTRRAVFATAAGAFSAALALVAQQTPDSQLTFRSSIELVDVEVSVLDRYRLPVRGLSAADFTVLEEGKPRPIAAFTAVNLPPRVLPPAKWMGSVAPDVQTNAFAKEGRLIVILMDRSIEAGDYPEARRIAENTVNQLRAGDMAAIVWSQYGIPQNFTADRERLLESIREPIVNLPGTDQNRAGACNCGLCTMEAIVRIAEGIQDVGWRRKMLLFVGHRLPGRGAGCGGAADALSRRVMRAAEVGNLTIHVIDPRGVETLGTPASLRAAQTGPVGANVRRIATLLAMTKPTGGRLIATNQASTVLPEVFRESDSYYVLGFPPEYTGTDGRFRRISVKVNRPDVILQSRRGYYAPGRQPAPTLHLGEDVSPALTRSISGLWPKTDMSLAIGAIPVAKGGVRGGIVAVLVRAQQDMRPQGASETAPASSPLPRATAVNVVVGAFDSNGKAVAVDRQQLTLTPRPVSEQVFEYEVVSRLELKPGRYEIRAAVEDSTVRRTASAYAYVDVPDFAQELVSLSGVFLQAGSPAEPLPGAGISDLVPVTPTSRRQFARTEQVTAFVHEYQGQARSFMPGYAVTEILDASDTRVYHQEQRILPTSGEHRALDFAMNVPVNELSPGQYLLTIQVRHGNESARRDVRFEVK